jgi:predicted ATP-grasp superfamily ATP-dependent carboligase
MNKLTRSFTKLDSYLFKARYVLSEICHARLSDKRKLKILFSKKAAWEANIRRFSRYLPHTLTFADINPQSIAEHDLIVPLVIEDVLYLNQVRDLTKNNLIPIPSTECVQLCDDKYVFAKKLIAHGFADYIPQIEGELSYPFFMKRKKDMGGANAYFIENEAQERALMNSVNRDDYFRQKFVSGTSEYAAHILFNKQSIVRVITLEYIFEKEGSIAPKDEMFGIKMHRNNPYLNIFTDILNCIGYEGICCIDYKVIDNRPCIFEINPRFGGNLSPFFFSFIRSLN